MADTGPARPSGGLRRRWLVVASGLSVVALYLWDDALLSAPLIALTATAGPLPAFLIGATVYGGASFLLALLAVRAYDRWSQGRPSRLARWLERQADGRRGAWGRRLLTSGAWLGFVVSSFLLGGIVTTWFVRYAGRREGIRQVAAASSIIFGVTFAGFYTGLAAAVLAL